MKWILALGVGFVGGWAVRSLSDSGEGAGVKLLQLGLKGKERLDRWAALERERLDDMLAEARVAVEQEGAHPASATNRTAGKGPSSNGPRRSPLVAREERA